MIDPDALAADVLRADLSRPGFALRDAGDVTSDGMRRLLVHVGRGLARHALDRYGTTLVFYSLNWFSQLAPTRPHRDGGPDGSVLLLGYEPSAVRSRVRLLDHSRAAAEAGLHPREFLDRYNPTFGDGAALLVAHTAEPAGLDPSRPQLLAVNNSCLDVPGLLGVLHQGLIDHAPPGATRPIGSVLLGVAERGLSDEHLDRFIRAGTAAVAEG